MSLGCGTYVRSGPDPDCVGTRLLADNLSDLKAQVNGKQDRVGFLVIIQLTRILTLLPRWLQIPRASI